MGINVGPYQEWITTEKTVTFDGTSGLGLSGTTTNWFTTSGGIIEIDSLNVYSVLTPVSAGGGTLNLGYTGSATRYQNATVASTLTTNKFWLSGGTADTAGRTLLNAQSQWRDVMVGSQTIRSAVATADITGGTLTAVIRWRPLTSGAAVAAA